MDLRTHCADIERHFVDRKLARRVEKYSFDGDFDDRRHAHPALGLLVEHLYADGNATRDDQRFRSPTANDRVCPGEVGVRHTPQALHHARLGEPLFAGRDVHSFDDDSSALKLDLHRKILPADRAFIRDGDPIDRLIVHRLDKFARAIRGDAMLEFYVVVANGVWHT